MSPVRKRERQPRRVKTGQVLSCLLFLVSATKAAADSTPEPPPENRTCYYMDGSISTDSWPCDNSTGRRYSTCCPPGATCYSNGVCAYKVGDVLDYQRVGCTDRSWTGAACLKRCRQYTLNGTAGIRPCNGITQGIRYCCDDGSAGTVSYQCCQNSSNVFELGKKVAEIAAVMPLSGAGSVTSDASTRGNGSDPDTSGVAETGSGGGGEGGGGRGAGAARAANNARAIGLGVGLGVGLPLVAAVAGAIFFALWRAKRRDAALSAPAPAGAPPEPETTAPPTVGKHPWSDGDGGLPTTQAAGQELPPRELPANMAPAELPPRELPANIAPAELPT